jgi:hypothetical protein
MYRLSLARLGSLLTLVGAVAILLPGCSRPVGTVSGKVTYQGKPLKGGSVGFVSSEGRLSFASGIKEDGTYSVPNIAGGSYKVTVETSSLKPEEVKGAMPGATTAPVLPKGTKLGPAPENAPAGFSDPAAMAAGANKRKYVAIPDNYANPDQSGLTYEFKGGSETYDIELK